MEDCYDGKPVRIYVNIFAFDETLPPDVSVMARDILLFLGERSLDAREAIVHLSRMALGPFEVEIEWHYGETWVLNALLQTDERGRAKLVEGGLGGSGYSRVTPQVARGTIAYAIGAMGHFDPPYGPESILHWIAFLLKDRPVPPDRVSPEPEPEPGSLGGLGDGSTESPVGYYRSERGKVVGDA